MKIFREEILKAVSGGPRVSVCDRIQVAKGFRAGLSLGLRIGGLGGVNQNEGS